MQDNNRDKTVRSQEILWLSAEKAFKMQFNERDSVTDAYLYSSTLPRKFKRI